MRFTATCMLVDSSIDANNIIDVTAWCSLSVFTAVYKNRSPNIENINGNAYSIVVSIIDSLGFVVLLQYKLVSV